MLPRLRRRLVQGLGIAGLALLPAACGGGDALAVDPVAQAAVKTVDASSYRTSYELTMTFPGPVGAWRVVGDGVVDGEAKRASLSFEVEGPEEMTQALGSGALDGEVVYDGKDGPVVYFRSAALGGALPSGKQWLKLDLAAAAGAAGQSSSLFQLDQLDPSRFLEFLRGVSKTEEAGYDRVRGVFVTRYTAELDLHKAAELAPEESRAYVGQALELLGEQTGLRTVPVEVFVDEGGLVRRVEISFTMSLPELPGRVEARTAQDYFDFGTDAKVELPAAGDTVDAGSVPGLGLGG